MLRSAVTEITSALDPRIDFFRELRGNHPRLIEANLILIEGELQFERLLESTQAITTIFFEFPLFEKYHARIAQWQSAGITLFAATREVMESIVGYRLHRGCMALATKPRHKRIDELRGTIVALDRIIDPENVGSIARNCVAFNVSSILVDAQSADPLLRRAIRVSMGAALFLDRTRVESLPLAVESLRSHYQIIGVDNVEGSIPLPVARGRLDDHREQLLIFGNEREGLAPEVIRACEMLVRVEMSTSVVSSLNVNAASAICLNWLYEARGAKNALDQPPA